MGRVASGRTITLTIDSELENVPLLGRAVQALCQEAGLPDRETHDLELCLIEAVTNAIRHAYRGEPGHAVAVSLTVGEEILSLRIEDHGLPMEPPREPPRLDYDPGDPQSLPEGGMGRYIMHALMDRVDYRREGTSNVLTLEKHHRSA